MAKLYSFDTFEWRMETDDQSDQKENRADQQVSLNVIERMETWQVLQSVSDSSKSNSRLLKIEHEVL